MQVMSEQVQIDLDRRVQRLEDIESIHRLKADYAAACDGGYDGAGFAGLFVEDGVWEGIGFGIFTGRTAIAGFISGCARETPWIVHFITNARIDVSDTGDCASGSFYLLEVSRITDQLSAPEGDDVIGTAHYNDTFVKREGRWYFQRVTARWHQISTLQRGWTRQRFRSSAATWEEHSAVGLQR
jgi:hypothetical protein